MIRYNELLLGVDRMEKEKKKNLQGTFKYLKRTYLYAKKEKKYLFYFLIGCILLSAISVLAPLLSAKQLVALTSNIWTQLFWITVAIFAIELLRNLIRYINNYFINKYFFAVKKNIQMEVAKETLKINTDTLNKHSSGVFIERMGNDTETLADIFILVIDYLTYLISMIGIFFSIFFLNRLIFFLYFLFLLILFFSQKFAANQIQKKRKIQKEKADLASGFASEIVRGAKDIKILNAEESFLKKADGIIDELNKASYDLVRTRRKFQLYNGNIRDTLDVLIMLLGLYFILHNQLEVATMIIILSYRGNIMSISGNIESFFENIKRFTLAATRIFDVIDGSQFPKEQFGTKAIAKIDGTIEFQDVFFEYEEKDPILKGINFKIKPNETVSFVGKSGSGKSTIFNLIAGLYYPNQGKILLDGIPTKELTKDSIRGNLSIISQNPYIFNMSIRENLQIIKKDLTEEEMIEACKMACLHDYIMTLKDGYDTMIGEGGVTLSGGQRQRLAIARALVQKTEIILFDEATSALDNETQAQIQKSIQNMQGEYTILIIAHRLSTVINSDRLILINDGKVAGIGTHEELLKTNPLYQNLYELELKEEKKN